MEPFSYARADKDFRHRTAPPRLLRCSRQSITSESDLESKQCEDSPTPIEEVSDLEDRNIQADIAQAPRWLMMAATVSIIAAVIYYGYFAFCGPGAISADSNSLRNLHRLLPKETVQNVRAAVSLMKSDSEHHKVGVVLLASTESSDSDGSAACVAKALASALSGGKGASILDVRTFDERHPIARQIERELRQNQILVLRHIERLQMPWILYRFCDAESPSIPDRIFLLTCAFGQNVAGVEGQRSLQNFLRRMWMKDNQSSPVPFDVEQVDPLFSRIANNVVFVGHPVGTQC